MEFRAWVAWALGLCLFVSGCSSLALPGPWVYESNPNDGGGQMRQMLNLSDGSVTPKSSEGAGAVDRPSHLTPDRVHGGIGP
jgi:hypothetical protein